MKKTSFSRGFTLIEMMVAVSLFAIVMLIGVGALLSLVQANARAQAINSVMNNLNAALEDMSRSIRVGTTYHCETPSSIPSALTSPKNCESGGGYLLAFEPAGSDISPITNPDYQPEVYRLNGTQLERSLFGGAEGTWVAMTAPEVQIDQFSFYVIGACSSSGSGSACAPSDTIQPRVVMSIRGSAQVPGGRTTFNVQASVVQRLLDL